MSENKFNKAPLSQAEKEKKAEAFLGFIDANLSETKKPIIERKLEKEVTKTFPLRVPESLLIDLKEISALTGISINAICLELLRPCIKKKLKELRESE